MYYARIRIESSTPLLYGKRHARPDTDGIGPAAFDAKFWKDRAHIDSNGKCYVPRHAFKMALCTAAQKLKLKYRGMTTWAAYMGPACKVLSDVLLDQGESQLKAFSRDVPSNGRPGGGGTRVLRTFAMLEKWSGWVDVQIIIPVLTQEIFTRHLNYLGIMVGLGMWSPRRNGDYGTFLPKIKQWEDRDGWPDLGFSSAELTSEEDDEDGDEAPSPKKGKGKAGA